MNNTAPFCCIGNREHNFEYLDVVWIHTGACGYYLVIGLPPEPCFVSGKLTNYVDANFEAPLHPEHYEEAWDSYIKTVQPSLIP